MEWQDWLEKEDKEIKKKPTMFPRIRREFDDETHEDPYVNNSISSVDSWESWLEKEEKPKERDYLAEMQTQGEQNMYQNSSKKKKFLKEAKGAGKKIKQQMGENDLPLSYSNRLRTNIKRPAKRVTDNDLSDLDGWVEETKSWETWLEKNDPCWEGYEQYGMKDKDGKKVPNCIKKNNAIETSHKEDEKKHEWDGKFSSSTIRDDVKDDDDKAVSEEESLEELTDGKLEEVEKLKSWELWLEKDALTNRWIETIPKKPKNNAMEDSQNYSRQSTGARYDYDNRSKRSNKPKYSKLGDVGDVTGDTILTNEGEKTGKFSKNHNVGGSKSNALADSSKKRQQNAVTKKPTIPSTGEAPTGVEKSWELWLNKYEETPEDKKLALQIDEARAVTGKKVATQKVKPETGEDAKMGEYSTITAEKFKSWTTWLEKMQGAGDARFGNQHLTGLDQKPVDNKEDEANILPEKEEKTDDKEEKQEKTEDKEDKDNKPYKALSQE